MSELLYVASIVSGLIFRKSKICTIFILFVMFVFSAFRYNDADYANYSSEYYSSDGAGRYLGYSVFIRFFATLGVGFEDYIILFTSIVLLILYLGIKSLTDKTNFVLSCFLICYYGLEVVQMKSFLANVLIVLAFSILLRMKADMPNKKLKLLSVVILLAVSTLVHFVAVYFFIVLIIFGVCKKLENYLFPILIFSFASFGLMLSGGIIYVIQYANAIGILGDMGYLMGWFQGTTQFGFILPYIHVGLIAVQGSLISYNRPNSGIASNWSKYNDPIVLRNIRIFLFTALLTLPLLYINLTFGRILRVYMLFIFIYFANRPIVNKYTFREFLGWGTLFVMLIFIFFTGIYLSWDRTMGALLQYNVWL